MKMKMNNAYGIVPIRKCTLEEEKIVQHKYKQIEETLEKNRCNQVYWANIYFNEQYCFQGQQKDKDIKFWAQKLVQQIQNGVPHHISSIGFLNNPSTNQKYQPFHFDYTKDAKQLFIPLTNLVYGNSPQFFDFPLKSKPKVNPRTNLASIYAYSEKQLLESEEVDFLTISQLICKPFTILKMHPGTIHRGIRNSTGQDRFMFYILYAQQKLVLQGEKAVVDQIDK